MNIIGNKRRFSDSDLSLDLPQLKKIKFNNDSNDENIITQQNQILKVENSELTNKLEDNKKEYSNHIECLKCEIAILNELVESKNKSPISNKPKTTTYKEQLTNLLNDIMIINQQMVSFLKDTKQRRQKTDIIIKSKQNII